jgi:hypothetical protein
VVWFVGHERVESEALMALGKELDRVANLAAAFAR